MQSSYGIVMQSNITHASIWFVHLYIGKVVFKPKPTANTSQNDTASKVCLPKIFFYVLYRYKTSIFILVLFGPILRVHSGYP